MGLSSWNKTYFLKKIYFVNQKRDIAYNVPFYFVKNKLKKESLSIFFNFQIIRCFPENGNLQ